jgi:predicted nuclease of predicted toxin-antitoxin system
MMRFKIDEDLPDAVADLLRQNQHDALTTLEQQLAGHPDPQIATVCQAEQRALVTLDLDFADIRSYPPEQYPGIIVLRPALQTVPSILSMMRRVLVLLDQEPLPGRLWIVDDHQVRIRDAAP